MKSQPLFMTRTYFSETTRFASLELLVSFLRNHSLSTGAVSGNVLASRKLPIHGCIIKSVDLSRVLTSLGRNQPML